MRDALVGQVIQGTNRTSYYLRECIGEGGQGWVFRANYDDPTGLVVIVKVLRPDTVGGDALRRFQREAEVLRMLSQQSRPNPHVVRFFDHAVAQVPVGNERIGLPFTVLEYVNGPTLEHVLRSSKGRGLAVERVRRIMRQVVLALDAVHGQKVVHRDLKPSNILLATEAGTEIAKVTDFGLVKLVDVNLQRTAALAGASLGYAPPEQYEQGNQRVSPRTDVFSLAAILFEVLTGKPAFPFKDGENPLLIVTRILNGPRPQLVRERDHLPPELAGQLELIEALDKALGRGLAADPAERFEGVQEFWGQVEPHLRAAVEPRMSVAPASAISPFQATEPSFRDGPVSAAPARVSVPVAVGGVPSRLTPQNPYAGSEAPRRGSGMQRAAPRVPDVAAANPAAWAWSVIIRTIKPGTVRCAAFAASGEVALAAGPGGIARLDRQQWIGVSVPPAVDLRAVRGICWLPEGDAVIYGERSLVHRIGSVTRDLWNLQDREITFLGGHCDETGVVTLVGERPYRQAAPRAVPGNTTGAIAQIKGERVTLVAEASSCTRLNAVTKLAGGTFVACGDWGHVVRLEMGVAEHVGAICGGHLTAIEAMPDGGAVTVGVGGHALYMNPRLEAQLEAVQTTRDIHALTVGDDGAAWAGSAQARLLRRAGGTWVRMSGDVGITPSVVALHAAGRVVRAICDDGAVIEGRLTAGP
jgi:serine/threonine-protein kinase